MEYTSIELTGVSRLNVIENSDSQFQFESVKKWILYHSTEYKCNLVKLALELERYKALEKLLDILEIPTDLSIKERLAYYQLLSGQK